MKTNSLRLWQTSGHMSLFRRGLDLYMLRRPKLLESPKMDELPHMHWTVDCLLLINFSTKFAHQGNQIQLRKKK
jgi:hypothetical protein